MLNNVKYIMEIINNISRFVINISTSVLIILIIYYLISIGNNYIQDKRKIQFKRKHYVATILILILTLLIFLIFKYKEIVLTHLKPIIWAMVISYLFNPLINKLTSYNISRTWSVLLLYVGLILLMGFSIFIITPIITSEIKGLVEILPVYTKKVFDFINKYYNLYITGVDNLPPELVGVEVAILDYLERIQILIISFFKRITEMGLNLFSNVVSIILIPIYTFYFLKDANFFRKKIIKAIPLRFRKEILEMGKDIDSLLSRFIRGQLIICFIVGILSIIALLILDVNFAFLIGTIAGITDIIPYFGPVISAIPAVIIALLDEPIKAFWVIIAFTIIQQFESTVLSPKIVGDSVGIHPVFVMIILLVSGHLFGLVGLIFSIPIAGSIKIILYYIVKALNKAY